MKHDTVAWSLQVGDQRYIYVIHGRHFAMKSGDADWVVGSYSSEANAHDFAVKSTAGHGSKGKITEGPVSFTLPPIAAATLRESTIVTDRAARAVEDALTSAPPT